MLYLTSLKAATWLTSVVSKHSARHDLVYLVEATDSRAAIFPVKLGRGGDPDLLAIGIYQHGELSPAIATVLTDTLIFQSYSLPHTEHFMSFK